MANIKKKILVGTMVVGSMMAAKKADAQTQDLPDRPVREIVADWARTQRAIQDEIVEQKQAAFAEKRELKRAAEVRVEESLKRARIAEQKAKKAEADLKKSEADLRYANLQKESTRILQEMQILFNEVRIKNDTAQSELSAAIAERVAAQRADETAAAELQRANMELGQARNEARRAQLEAEKAQKLFEGEYTKLNLGKNRD